MRFGVVIIRDVTPTGFGLAECAGSATATINACATVFQIYPET